MSRERRFERIHEQDDMRRYLERSYLWRENISCFNGRLTRGDVGMPFEQRVGSILREGGYRPLVEFTTGGRSFRAYTTRTFGGVQFSSRGNTVLELDGLFDNNGKPIVVEAKTGGPGSSFAPKRMELIRACVADVWRSLRDESLTSIAMTVVVPRLDESVISSFERLGSLGVDLVQAPISITTLREQVIAYIRNSRR